MKKENIDPKELLRLSENVKEMHNRFTVLEAKTDLKMSEVSIMMEETDKLYSQLVRGQQELLAYSSGITLEEFKKQFSPFADDENTCADCGGALDSSGEHEDDDDEDDEKSEFSVDDLDDEDETV